MKNLMCFVFCVIPFLGFGQDMDSVRVAGEVDSLIKVCRGLLDNYESEEALLVIGIAKNIATTTFGMESAKYADCIFNKGRIFYFTNNYSEAEPLYLEAKNIYEKVFGNENLKYANMVNGLGNLYKVKGETQKALTMYLEAKMVLGKILGTEHPNYAVSLHNLAMVYQEKGEYDKALQLFLEAKDIREKILGKDDLDYAQTVGDMAILYMNKGGLDKAVALNLEAKSIREKVLGKDDPNYAFSPFNLAIVYQLKGEYDKALPLYLEAKGIWAKVWGKEDPYYADCLNSLALLYMDMGEYDKALPLNLEVKGIREKILGKEHPDYAGCVNNLAMAYQLKGEYDKALPLYIESKDIFEKSLGKEHPTYAIFLNNMAEIYLNKGEFDKAESLNLDAKSIREKVLGKEHPDYARSLCALAIAYKAKGEYSKALSLLIEGNEIWKKTLGKDHPDYAMSLDVMASVYSDQGDNITASTYFISSNKVTKSLLQKSAAYSTEHEMQQYQATLEERFDHLLRFTQTHPTDSLRFAAYDNALFLNNAQLFNAVAREKGIAYADSSTRAIHAEWKSCHFQLGRLYSQPIAERDSGLVARLEEQANGCEKELVRRSPEFAEAQKEVYWQDVKSQLNPNEAAIEFVNYHWYDRKTKTDTTMYTALVLTPGSTAPAFIPLCQEADLLAVLDQPQTDRAGYFDRLYRGIKPKANAKVEGLYQLLWQPLDSLLGSTKRIYFAPSGIFHRINMAALPAGQGESIGSKYELVQLGSTRQLVTKNNQTFTNKDAIVLGGINYEAENAAPTPFAGSDSLAVEDDALAFGSSPDFNSLTRSLRGGEWNYLEGTEKEATDIAKLLKNKGFKAKKLNGHAATEEAFKAIGQGVPSPRVLHIATHGFFFPDPKTVDGGRQTMDGGQAIFKQSDNPMIRSGLILAGANPVWKGEPTPAGTEDGILTAYEISQMNLSNTELAVLSACETGLGDIQGNEGVYGLQRAFKIAGAKHLIMSLWDVPDAETAEFMNHFYKEWLGGKDIQAAFRHTQQVMRDAYPNEPFLWAGFVLVE